MLPLAMTLLSGGPGNPPTLLPAHAVDLSVKEIRWHPHGGALFYARELPDGLGLGVFGAGDAEGKVVLRLDVGDEWNCCWLPGSADALVTVTGKGETNGTAIQRVALYLVDVRRKTAKEVFAKVDRADQKLSLDVDPSPGLVHAIVTLTEEDRTTHLILPLNGGPLVSSPDIDQAIAKGFAGPSWTRDGTATYDQNTFTFSEVTSEGSFLSNGGGNSLRSQTDSSNQNLLALTFKARFYMTSPPAKPEGKPTYEVVPTNGVIRPVRSPGPWAETPTPTPTFAAGAKTMQLALDSLRTETPGLCLFGVRPGAEWRVIVAPRAQWGLLAPYEGSIAYAVDGALFVRDIDRR